VCRTAPRATMLAFHVHIVSHTFTSMLTCIYGKLKCLLNTLAPTQQQRPTAQCGDELACVCVVGNTQLANDVVVQSFAPFGRPALKLALCICIQTLK
jgi:hypothetical protein